MFKSMTLLDFQFEKADILAYKTSSKHVEDILRHIL